MLDGGPKSTVVEMIQRRHRNGEEEKTGCEEQGQVGQN